MKRSNETPFLLLYYKNNCRSCAAVKKSFNLFSETLKEAKKTQEENEGKKSLIKEKMDKIHFSGDISFAKTLQTFRMNILNESFEFSCPKIAPVFYFFRAFPDGLIDSSVFNLQANHIDARDQERVTRKLFEQSEIYCSR